MTGPREKNAWNALDKLIDAADAHARASETAPCKEAAYLFRIAKLVLQMKRHAITDEQLAAFCDVLERNAARNEKNGELRGHVMVGLDQNFDPAMLGRRNLLFRLQDRSSRKSSRARAGKAKALTAEPR